MSVCVFLLVCTLRNHTRCGWLLSCALAVGIVCGDVSGNNKHLYRRLTLPLGGGSHGAKPSRDQRLTVNLTQRRNLLSHGHSREFLTSPTYGFSCRLPCRLGARGVKSLQGSRAAGLLGSKASEASGGLEWCFGYIARLRRFFRSQPRVIGSRFFPIKFTSRSDCA